MDIGKNISGGFWRMAFVIGLLIPLTLWKIIDLIVLLIKFIRSLP